MEWVFKIAGILSSTCGVVLMLLWFLLISITWPDGQRLSAGDSSIIGMPGFGILLILAGLYLACSKPKPTG
ncbi:hypothetical protein [Paludisphaera borealis]|uniref:Uncharacterized protein n=1 Tax=Paludisphaera borealis TaxID=1387353 RepID=A0A1U7CSD7_9BACT|nr:hypothetical protein [Paludisphaera borealis]APW61809.1 hypothetical protein BSF38_03338 [Paludisphaera borealis]